MSKAAEKYKTRKEAEAKAAIAAKKEGREKVAALYICDIKKAEALQNKGFLVETITNNLANPLILDYGFKKTSELKKEVGI